MCIRDRAEADVLITSYDLLKRDILYYEDLHFHYEIIDEAQYIKNHNTQNAKSVKVINSAVRFALTGTPVENSLAAVSYTHLDVYKRQEHSCSGV